MPASQRDLPGPVEILAHASRIVFRKREGRQSLDAARSTLLDRLTDLTLTESNEEAGGHNATTLPLFLRLSYLPIP